MTPTAVFEEARRRTSPLFNARKLKLGTSGSNLGGGCAISTIDGTLLSWPRHIDDMRWFQSNVMPLVGQAGLR